MNNGAAGWSLAELSARTGLPGRTIRFYITRGLVPGPVKAGRSARYPAEALSRLQEIQRLQSRGHTLAEVAQRTASRLGTPLAVEPEAWWHYRLAKDVLVSVRADTPPWRLSRIRRQMAQLAVGLETNDEREQT
jgi:DNA-binding transcriptional MerR regulator